jgi:hypothetical protein
MPSRTILTNIAKIKFFTWTKDAGASISRAKKFTDALGIAG